MFKYYTTYIICRAKGAAAKLGGVIKFLSLVSLHLYRTYQISVAQAERDELKEKLEKSFFICLYGAL